MDKTIRRITSTENQEIENYRYWQSRSVGDRLIAVCELSEASYAFAAAFKGVPAHDDRGFQGSSPRVQRKRG